MLLFQNISFWRSWITNEHPTHCYTEEALNKPWSSYTKTKTQYWAQSPSLRQRKFLIKHWWPIPWKEDFWWIPSLTDFKSLSRPWQTYNNAQPRSDLCFGDKHPKVMSKKKQNRFPSSFPFFHPGSILAGATPIQSGSSFLSLASWSVTHRHIQSCAPAVCRAFLSPLKLTTCLTITHTLLSWGECTLNMSREKYTAIMLFVHSSWNSLLFQITSAVILKVYGQCLSVF